MSILEITPMVFKNKSNKIITSIQPKSSIKKPVSDVVNSFIVKIETSDGLVGYGESMCTFAAEGAQINTGTVLSHIIKDIIKPYIYGRNPYESQRIYKDIISNVGLDISGGLFTHALSAVDIALWDLYGKETGEPIYKLMGEKKRNSIRLYASKLTGVASLDDNEKYLSSLKNIIDFGFKGVKIGGGLGINNDIESVRLARETCGANFCIMLDCYGAYSVKDSIDLAKKLEPYNIEWLEAPTEPNDKNGNVKISQVSGLTIGLDPIINKWNYKDHLFSGGNTMGLVDVTRDGGISEFKEYNKIAEVLGGGISTHSGWSVTSVGVLASAQMAAAFEAVSFMEFRMQFEDNPLSNNILRTPIEIRDGNMVISSGPGLGTDIDEGKLNDMLDSES